MRILKDFKIPNFKFPKFKMEGIEEIGEVKIDPNKPIESKKDKLYIPTSYNTIKEIFKETTDKHGNNVFILEKFKPKEDFTKMTYNDFKDDVINFGTAITNFLNMKDERIVIIGENTYDWYVSYMALLCGAGLAVPVDKELPNNEIENVVSRAKATVVIYSTKKKDDIKKIKDSLPGVKYFIQMNSNDGIDGKDVGFDYLIREGKKLVSNGDNSFMDITIDKEEFKVLIFTSGTTSKSKGVMICNRNLAENINSITAFVNLTAEDRLMSILPLHHTYESTIGFLYPFSMGASISICQGLKYIVPDLKETNPTALLTVPLLVENLYRKINSTIEKSGKAGLVSSMIHVTNALKSVNVDIKRKVFKEIHDNLGGNIRIVVSAAAPIDSKIGKWLQDIGITFLQGYGLTETAPIAALTPEFNPKIGSTGKAVMSDEIIISNPNENGEGEILIKGSTVMLGYYEDEKATDEAIEDGWFHSGDIGYLDNESFLYITGRSKNVIVTQNGKNIYPEEIELLLGKIPEIKECMVYGKEAQKERELIISVRVIPNLEVIEEKYHKEFTDEELYSLIWTEIKKINKELTSYKVIKKLEIKKDEFEKTTTMKIKRFEELKKI